MRVTYADVWEFWLRHRDVAAAVDFITVHILPYWEDHPIPVGQAARHVDLIRKQVVAAFPDKEIFLGEFGWPSAGRMREGALAVAGQRGARAARGGGARQARELSRQPDRGLRPALEAQAGRHRRRLSGGSTTPTSARRNSSGARAVSNHPNWRWQAAGGIAFAALVFGAALAACWRRPPPPARRLARRRGDRAGVGNADRLDDPEHPDRKPVGDRLDPLAVVGGGRVRRADCRRGRARVGRQGPEPREHARTPRRRSGRSARLCARRAADRSGGAGGAGGARSGVQSALPRFSVHGADRRGRFRLSF